MRYVCHLMIHRRRPPLHPRNPIRSPRVASNATPPRSAGSSWRSPPLVRSAQAVSSLDSPELSPSSAPSHSSHEHAAISRNKPANPSAQPHSSGSSSSVSCLLVQPSPTTTRALTLALKHQRMPKQQPTLPQTPRSNGSRCKRIHHNRCHRH